MSNFAIRMRESMEKKGITAAELSRRTGIGKNLISYYLNEKYLPKQDKVYAIAQALGVDPGWLMTGVEQRHYNPPVVLLDSELFLKIWDHMPVEDCKIITELFNKTQKVMQEKGLL